MAQVKFAKGLKSSFDKITKDPNTVYIITDTQEIYVGAQLVGNVYMTDINIEDLNTTVGTLQTSLAATDKRVSGIDTRVTTVEDAYPIEINPKTGTGNIATSYEISQNGKIIGTIDTIKDKVVSSGKYDSATKSIVLTLNDSNTVSIPVAELIDVYTGVKGSEINVVVSADNKISASIVSGSIGKSKLNSTVQAILDKADNADSQLDWEDF